MDGWPEYWLNTGSAACLRNIHAVMTKRIQLAKRKGFDAVDPVRCQRVARLSEQDNIDASENKTGWPISSKQSIAYLKWLAKTALRALTLSVAGIGAKLIVAERHRAVRGVQRVQGAAEGVARLKLQVYAGFPSAGKLVRARPLSPVCSPVLCDR